MKGLRYLLIVLMMISVTPIVHAQSSGSSDPKKKQSMKSKRRERQEDRAQAKADRRQKRAEQKAIKAHHKRLQTKAVRKRMKASKKRAIRNHDNRREFFLTRWLHRKK